MVDVDADVFSEFGRSPANLHREAIQAVHLTGSPYERGVAHGSAVGSRLEHYWSELARDVTDLATNPMSRDELRSWILERSKPALAAAPDLEEEIRGLAHGAGVTYEVALAVNFGEEVGHLASMREAAGRASERCLSILVPPEKSASGGYLLAQTWDGPSWTPDPVLFYVEEEAGRSVYLSDGGWVGGVGLNDRGIGSVHTGVGTSRDGTPGFPYPFIARRILQSGTVDEACESAVDLPATAGCHYIVCDGAQIRDVEVAGEVNATRPMVPPVSTCAHFCDAALAALEYDADWHRISVYRTGRLVELLSRQESVGPLDLFALMSDHEEGPLGAMVCRHADSDRTGSRSLGSIVVDMAGAVVFARAGNPCELRPGFFASPRISA